MAFSCVLKLITLGLDASEHNVACCFDKNKCRMLQTKIAPRRVLGASFFEGHDVVCNTVPLSGDFYVILYADISA